MEAENSTSATGVGLVRTMPPILAGKASRSRISSLGGKHQDELIIVSNG